MPIQGLTDNVQPRFPRLGKLRKGGAKENKGGKETYGKDLNHWRFTSDRPEIVAAFAAAYGKEPVRINVFLPYASLEDSFATWKEAWNASSLLHRCDGVTCTIWLNGNKYEQSPKPCPGGCKEVGRLTVVIPELIQAGFVGYVTVETHSKNDLIQITETLAAVAEQRTGNPAGLRGIPFVLGRKPEKISAPGWGENKDKRQRVEKWLISLEPVASWAETQLQLMNERPVAQLPPPSILTASGAVDPKTGEVLDPPDDDDDAPTDAEEGTWEHVEARTSPVTAKAQPAPKPAPVNGDKPKPAILKTPNFGAAFVALVEKLDAAGISHSYRKGEGLDYDSPRYQLASLGYESVTPENLAAAIAALEAHAIEKAQA